MCLKAVRVSQSELWDTLFVAKDSHEGRSGLQTEYRRKFAVTKEINSSSESCTAAGSV